MNKNVYVFVAVAFAVIVTCGCGQSTVQQSDNADEVDVIVGDDMGTEVDTSDGDVQVRTPGTSVDTSGDGVRVETPGVTVDID